MNIKQLIGKLITTMCTQRVMSERYMYIDTLYSLVKIILCNMLDFPIVEILFYLDLKLKYALYDNTIWDFVVFSLTYSIKTLVKNLVFVPEVNYLAKNPRCFTTTTLH